MPADNPQFFARKLSEIATEKLFFLSRFSLGTCAALLLVVILCSCGGGNTATPPRNPITAVTITPTTAQLRVGDSLLFDGRAMGTSIVDPTVTWSVAGIPGGDATHGTIVRGGRVARAFDFARATTPWVPPSCVLCKAGYDAADPLRMSV